MDDKDLEQLQGRLSDRRWRLNNLYKIVDEDANILQYRFNHSQKILYLDLWYYNVILKSRQHGITTFWCLYELDQCLFNDNQSCVIIAHNKEDAEEFFHNKIKFGYDNLDPVFREAIPATRDSTRLLRFANGSSIRVTTSGRSGTFNIVHISEFGKICAEYPKKAREIVTGTLNAIHPGQVIGIESTAEGREGRFYDSCEEARILQDADADLTKLDPRFHFFGWQDNPLNVLEPEGVVLKQADLDYFEDLLVKHCIMLVPAQKAWYVKKHNQQGDDMKREHPSTPDEAFLHSLEGTYYKTQFRTIRKEDRICSVPVQEGKLVNTYWDLGRNDDNVLWFTQDVGREIHVIDYYDNSGEGLQHYADILRLWREQKGYRYGKHWAPHDIMVHEYTSNKTRHQTAAEMGLKLEVAPKLGLQAGIEKVRQILAICVFDEVRTAKGYRLLEQYRKKWNDKTGAYHDAPLKSPARHAADAFRTLAVSHDFSSYMVEDTEDLKARREQARHRADPRGWT